MGILKKRLKPRRWRRNASDRARREAQARRAKTYVARDGRGRVIASH